MLAKDTLDVVDRIQTERPGPGRVALRATGRWRFPPGPLVGAMAQPVLCAVLTATTGLGLVGWLAGVAYAAVLGILLGRALRRRGRRSLAPADHVTLVRALLVGCVTALVADTA